MKVTREKAKIQVGGAKMWGSLCYLRCKECFSEKRHVGGLFYGLHCWALCFSCPELVSNICVTVIVVPPKRPCNLDQLQGLRDFPGALPMVMTLYRKAPQQTLWTPESQGLGFRVFGLGLLSRLLCPPAKIPGSRKFPSYMDSWTSSQESSIMLCCLEVE